MSIKLSNITKTYGEQKAVNNISFEIKTGEIVGFIGPNGAGKSTTMKILTGFISNFEGEAMLDGFNIRTQTNEAKRIVGYLPEHNPLYVEMYVREYLRFVAGIYKVPQKKERVEEVISLTGLSLESNKKISALSKGYRQRVGLASALIHDPQILILDEPTTGLDPNQIVEIRNLIANIGKTKTVILSTHIMQEVEAICDRVIIINKGKIVGDDSAETLKNNAKAKAFTVIVEFSGAANAETISQINSVAEVRSISDRKFAIKSENGIDPRQDIFNFAVQSSLAVLAMNIEEKTLEDAFRELTK